jgi:hypothetical protein
MIWFVVLTYILADGKVYTELYPASVAEHNNEKSCNLAGEFLASKKQSEMGIEVGKVYYICQSITEKEMDKALGKTSL